MAIEFFFDERKAAQAASVLLAQHEGRRMPYIKLVKLLYLADRAALIETGAPITGDRFVSMKFGPVLSHVLDLIKDDNPGEDSVWHSYVRREYFDAVLVCNPANDHLSEYDDDLLTSTAESYRDMKWWDVVTHTHALPEWTDPGETSVPIDPADILRYVGCTDAEVEEVASQAKASCTMRTASAAAR